MFGSCFRTLAAIFSQYFEYDSSVRTHIGRGGGGGGGGGGQKERQGLALDVIDIHDTYRPCS